MTQKDKWFSAILVVVGLLLVFVAVGTHHLFGSETDWLTQHIVFPDYFRTMFYETGNLIPNFSYSLGAGQNMFNFSYYGFLNPLILLSYFFPFIEMAYYIGFISIVSYVLTGLLCYRWFRNNAFDEKLAFFLSLVFLLLAPVLYQSHHHIMFVSYFPFLLVAFMGVDRHIKKGISGLLIVSTFLLIMTSYYYSICSIIAIGVYFIYSYIKHYEKIRLQCFIQLIKCVGISIMMSAVLLVPTMYVIWTNRSGEGNHYSLSDFLTPQFDELFYKPFSVGITAVFLLAIIALIFNKQKDIHTKFLAAIILFGSLCPVVLFVLNGGMYIRGKALIPLVPLFCLLLGLFLTKWQNKELHMTSLLILFVLANALIYWTGYTHTYFYLDSLVVLLIVLFSKKRRQPDLLMVATLVLLIAINLVTNQDESYVSDNYYEDIYNEQVEGLVMNTLEQDEGEYRFLNSVNKLAVANVVYDANYFSTSVYSSTANADYRDFYHNAFGNNIVHRNVLMTTSTDNPLFASYMGVKYIVSQQEDVGLSYEKVASKDGVNLFRNSEAFPLIYGSSQLTSESDLEKVDYPYTLNYYFQSIIVDGDVPSAEIPMENIQPYELSNLEEQYVFQTKKKVTYTIELDEPITNQYLLIQFDNEAINRRDTSITINGMKNKLTSSTWIYPNHNESFEYVLSSQIDIEQLDITVTKGHYNLTNVKLYTFELDMDNVLNELETFQITELDQKKSIINGQITIAEDGYVATSFPYDEGFNVQVDGKEIPIEKVNTAFLGFAISEGSHKVMISYQSPWLKEGLLLSLFGFVLLIATLIYERRKERSHHGHVPKV